MKNSTKLICFTLYTILYETLILGGFGYAVFILGFSGWWMLLAVILSGSQLKPKHFSLNYLDADDNQRENTPKSATDKVLKKINIIN